MQSAGGAATLSLSSQSLHLHIVLTWPLTGRHLLESAANTTCEKNQAGRNSFPIPTATCWLSFCALGKNGAKQQALDAEDRASACFSGKSKDQRELQDLQYTVLGWKEPMATGSVQPHHREWLLGAGERSGFPS